MRVRRSLRRRDYRREIRTAAELEEVLLLPDETWAANSAPVATMRADPGFLEYLDSDGNGRIMSRDVRNAAAWTLACVHDRRGLIEGRHSLDRRAINPGTEEGNALTEAFDRVARRLDGPTQPSLSLEEVRTVRAAVEAMPVTQAGVVLPEAADDPEVAEFIRDVVELQGGVPHPSGAVGVDGATVDGFLSSCRSVLAWRSRRREPAVEPFGEQTGSLADTVAALEPALDAYYAACRRLYLQRLVLGLPDTPAYPEGAAADETLLSRPREDRLLHLDQPVNPDYEGLVDRLFAEVVPTVIGNEQDRMTQSEWQGIQSELAAYRAWRNEKPTDRLDGLDDDQLEQFLDGGFAAAIDSLRRQSEGASLALADIRLAERAILYQAYLLMLINNFVTFPRLYDPNSRAIFETGSLVMDGRVFGLCLPVTERARHVAIAERSRLFVVYLEVQPAGEPSYQIAVPITGGTRGNVYVGKRGVFRDLSDRQRNAQVVQLIENPISLWEAMGAPFRRLAGLVTTRIEQMTATGEKQLDTAVSGPPSVAQSGGGGAGQSRGNLLLGGSVAVAALGSALAFVTKTVSELRWPTVAAGVGGAIAAFLLPASILAAVRLRKRELAPVLEASGWALNARMRLTRRQRRLFARLSGFTRHDQDQTG